MEEKIEMLLKAMEMMQKENRELREKVESVEYRLRQAPIIITAKDKDSDEESKKDAEASTSSNSREGGQKGLPAAIPSTPFRSAKRRRGKGDRDSLLADDGSPAAKALQKLNEKEKAELQKLIAAKEKEKEENEDEKIFMKAICSKPPFFTGMKHKTGDATLWIGLVEQICYSLDMHEDLKVEFARSYLREDALQWFLRTIILPNACSWASFKNQFLAMFEECNVEEYAKKQFYGLKQGGMTVREYHMKFCSLANLISGLTETTRTEYYIYGLNDKIRDHLLATNNIDSFEKASVTALRRGEFVGRKDKKTTTSTTPKWKDRPQSGERSQIECWNCGLRGHKREDCRRPPKQEGKQQKPWEKKKQLATMEQAPPQMNVTTPSVPKQGN